MTDMIHEMTTASQLQMKFTKNATNGAMADANITQGASVIAVQMTKQEMAELAAIATVLASEMN